MKTRWTVILAIGLGLLAVVLTNAYFRQREQRFRVEETTVVVAAKDITKGAVIGYDMLAFKTMPVKFIQPGALNSKEKAVGKTALVSIMAGEQVLATKLAQPGTGLTLAAKTPPGKRAFTIGVDAAAAVGGMVRPGDHVDVLAVFAQPAVTITLFQDVLVLAVGRQMIPTEEREGVERAPARREAVTLALSPQEVQILTVAMEHGKIKLTLRPRMEEGEAVPAVDLSQLPPAIDINTLLQFYLRRHQQVEERPQVEVIRGLKKEVTPLPAR